MKDIDTPVSDRSRRRFILEMKKAGFVLHVGPRNGRKWIGNRKLMEMATGQIIEKPTIVPSLCDLALQIYPTNTTLKAQLLKKMLSDIQHGSMKHSEESMAGYRRH